MPNCKIKNKTEKKKTEENSIQFIIVLPITKSFHDLLDVKNAFSSISDNLSIIHNNKIIRYKKKPRIMQYKTLGISWFFSLAVLWGLLVSRAYFHESYIYNCFCFFRKIVGNRQKKNTKSAKHSRGN